VTDGEAGAGRPAPTRAPVETGPEDEARLSVALRNLQPGLVVVDVEARRTILANDGALEAFGGRPDFAWVEANLLTPPIGTPGTLALDGRLIGYSVYGDGPLRLVFCRDITETQRRKSLAAASETAALFDELFMAIRHEVGNPLNSAKTALSVLRMNLSRLSDEAVAAGIDQIMEELLRVENLLRLLKTFVASAPLDSTAVDVAALLDEVAATAGPDLWSRKIVLGVSVGPAARSVRADGEALSQVLLALVSNAAEAAAGRPDASITLEARRRGGVVQIVVSDNGRGMSDRVRRNAFTPLFRTASGRLGFGLATARALLTRMEGTIELASVEGAGTVATVTLPAPEAGT